MGEEERWPIGPVRREGCGRTKISSAVRDCVLGPAAAAAAAASTGRGARGWSRNGFLDRGRWDWDGIGSSKGEVGVVGKEETSMRPGEVAR
jgi:hypothetical protein